MFIYDLLPAIADKTMKHFAGSTVTNTSAVGITDYAGPAPAAGSGPHRCVTRIHYMNRYRTDHFPSYVVVLYSQPASFQPPADLSTPGVPVSTFIWSDYVSVRPIFSKIQAFPHVLSSRRVLVLVLSSGLVF
jgi:hypothetical protein